MSENPDNIKPVETQQQAEQSSIAEFSTEEHLIESSDAIDKGLEAAEQTFVPDAEPAEEAAPAKEAVKTETAPEAAKAEEKAAPEPKPTESKEEPTEEAIPQPKGLSQNARVNWAKLEARAKSYQEKYETTLKRVQEQEQEMSKLKTSTPPVPEEINKELQRLKQLEAVHYLSESPEFKARYDQKIESVSGVLYDILQKNGMYATIAEATAAAKHNGWDDVPASVEQIKMDGGVAARDISWWQDSILPNLSILDQEKIKKSLMALDDITTAKEKELKNAQVNREELLRQNVEKQHRAFEEEKQIVLEQIDHFYKMAPWAKAQEIPANATPEQRKEIEAHNAKVKHYEEVFTVAYKATDPLTRAQMAASAVLAQRQIDELEILSQELQRREERIKELEGRIDKVKASSSIVKSGSVVGKQSAIVHEIDETADGIDQLDAAMRQHGL